MLCYVCDVVATYVGLHSHAAAAVNTTACMHPAIVTVDAGRQLLFRQPDFISVFGAHGYISN